MLFLTSRDLYDEAGPGGEVIFDVDESFVIGDDTIHNSQAQAGAAFAG